MLVPDDPLFIVFNCASGSQDGPTAQAEMHEILSARQRRHEFFVIHDPSQLRPLAERAAEAAVRENGVLVAAGGDGTINAVAGAALASERPFGIVPQGTFNYTPRAHGIPLDVRQATLSLLDSELAPTQVGQLNEHVFLVNASLGLYPELLEQREADKRRYGRYRTVAFWSGLRSLAQHHRQLTLEIELDHEREVVRTPALFVGNNALQLERVGLPEAQELERRRLAAVVVKPVSTPSLLWLALRGALGQLGGAERVRDFAFRRMVVRPRQRHPHPLKVATDGEVRWLEPPLTFSVSPRDLLLLAPRKPASEAAPLPEAALEAQD
ncbi:MAG TPA: diacylglycerol kinase family protein [Polyangiaceae bacterium]|nr:diacylglycerol kinase family protein [Polyangiaceae bacterium]